MKRNFTFIITGIFVALLTSVTCLKASGIPPVDSIYCYLKVDTAGVNVGYLQFDPATDELIIVDSPRNDFALWRIFQKPEEAVDNYYRILNKVHGDTMAFNVPEQAADTVAVINVNGILNKWLGMFDNASEPDSLKFYIGETYYYLSFGNDSVFLSPSGSEKTALTFSVERIKALPVDGTSYRLKVDTAGMPDVNPIGYLSADITNATNDSLTVSKIFDGALSLWEFENDTIFSDTTYFKITNKGTGKKLAFNHITTVSDTVASVDDNGIMSHWLIPFFKEDNGKGKLMVRDTLNMIDYYLGLDEDNTVKLISDITTHRYMTLLFEEDVLMPDSVVYKVKHLNAPGDSAGLFLASSDKGQLVYVDSVYAHIPNGQFVLLNGNRYNLMNRMSNLLVTGNGTTILDSLKYVVIDDSLMLNQYTNGDDIFEITKVEMGAYKNNPKLGYKSFTPEELNAYSYMFTQVSVDTLENFFMGYDVSDSLVMVLDEGDTTRFLVSYNSTRQIGGAPAIAGIPSLSRDMYYFSPLEDSALYMAKNDDGGIAMKTVSNRSSFFLKEDTIPGNYYFIEYNSAGLDNKVLINPSLCLDIADLDSTDTHSFKIEARSRKIIEPEPSTYLTELPSGAGFYELSVIHPLSWEEKYLTKNFYDYAVLGKEGESMLRAGSYTPFDLHLWVDTARGKGYNPEKPSFYIVKDVDTTATNFNRDSISGYYFHVMDSIDRISHEGSVYTNGAGDEFNRVNFVKAKRFSANELLLDNVSGAAGARDSVGFEGKNEDAINEYRFYLQRPDKDNDDGTYYIVTEAGYGDGNRTDARGYLSFAGDTLYIGPRDSVGAPASSRRNLKVTFRKSTVSNEVIPPPVIEEQSNKVVISGGVGQVTILNATGEEAIVYNILGQPVIKRVLASDHESVPAPRGIMIVRLGLKAQKVVVK